MAKERKPRRKTLGDNAVARMIVPVGRSAWALVAGYLGLLSVLLVPAPFALATGIIAALDIQKHPRKHGMGRAIFGIVMGAIGSIVGFVVLMMVILNPKAFQR
jgi:hypothetical protein